MTKIFVLLFFEDFLVMHRCILQHIESSNLGKACLGKCAPPRSFNPETIRQSYYLLVNLI